MKAIDNFYFNKLKVVLVFLLLGGLLCLNLFLFEAEVYAGGSWRYIVAPVGHGDAALLLNPAGDGAVIDAGTGKVSSDVFFDLLDHHDVDEIETLVLTHPHHDHISMAPDLLERYPVKHVWDIENDHTSQTYLKILNLVKQKGIDYSQPTQEQKREILPGLEVKILNPPYPPPDNLNEASLSFSMNIEGVTILTTGDAETEQENEWVSKYLIDDVDILNVGHHGSKTATGEQLLYGTFPEVAIISSPGQEKSPYGHPDQEVMDRLKRLGVSTYITGKVGYVDVTIDSGARKGQYSIDTYKNLP